MRNAIVGLVFFAASLSAAGIAMAADSPWFKAPAPEGYAALCGEDPGCLHPAYASVGPSQRSAFDWRRAFNEVGSDAVVVHDGPELPSADDAAVMALVSQVNREVNARVRPMPSSWEADLHWRLPFEDGGNVGDCRAVALEKRRRLALAGLSPSRLALAVVMTPRRKAHAVLLVASTRGEMVLDSLSPWLMPWSATGYRLVERQAYRQPGRWVQPALSRPAEETRQEGSTLSPS